MNALDLVKNPYSCGCEKDQRLRTLVDSLDDVKYHTHDEGALAMGRALVAWGDEQNMIRLKSLEGTPEAGKHSGLLIPMEAWAELRAALEAEWIGEIG